jgi:hypothetical protein
VHEFEPFSLSTAIGMTSDASDMSVANRIYKLKSIVQQLQALTQADWVGVYRYVKVSSASDKLKCLTSRLVTHKELGPALLKEAYVGEHSRAFFPVNADFAMSSSNSYVALYNTARHIPDITARHTDVGYYGMHRAPRVHWHETRVILS